MRAAEALTDVGGEADVAAKALAGALADKDVKVRREAAVALWRMGSKAKVAVAALGKALEDEDGGVRRDAAATLWRVGPTASSAVPALVEALKDGDREVRLGAAGALGAIGLGAKAAVPALTEGLRDKDPDTRLFAARALVRVGDRKAWAPAAPVLREGLGRFSDQRVRTELIVFLWTIGREPDSTFPTLKGGDTGDIVAATQLLRKADEGTRAHAVPTLVAALRAARDSGHRATRPGSGGDRPQGRGSHARPRRGSEG